MTTKIVVHNSSRPNSAIRAQTPRRSIARGVHQSHAEPAEEARGNAGIMPEASESLNRDRDRLTNLFNKSFLNLI